LPVPIFGNIFWAVLSVIESTKKARPKAILSFRFRLGGNFRSVAEGECHDTASSYHNLIDHSEPESLIPFLQHLWSFFNVADKDVQRFGLGEPFPFCRLQFVNPCRCLAMAFELAVVALVEVGLALGGSGVLIDCFA
jgi:hypothetical protein